jgi:hypothetical protein
VSPPKSLNSGTLHPSPFSFYSASFLASSSLLLASPLQAAHPTAPKKSPPLKTQQKPISSFVIEAFLLALPRG